MDGMLSQDEIQALLAGMDLSGEADASQPADTEDNDVKIDESLLTDDERACRWGNCQYQYGLFSNYPVFSC